MAPHLAITRFTWLALFFAGCVAAIGAPLATHPRLTFFSTLTEEPLGILEAESIGPRFVRHGPFALPAPGLSIESPLLTLHDQACTREDWARVLESIGGWQRSVPLASLQITLPDGRSFVCQGAPSTASGMLSGAVVPLNPDKAQAGQGALLLRIAHNGKEHLRIDLRPLPSVSRRPGPGTAAPAEAEEPSSSTSSPVAEPNSESIASP